jgi:hypothetical protein
MGAGKSTTVESFGEAHHAFRDETTLNAAGERLDEKPFEFKDANGESKPKKVQLYQCDNGLFVIGRYGDQRRGMPGMSGGVSRGPGADCLSGPAGRQALAHYVQQGFPHLLYEGRNPSAESFTDPAWEQWAREAGIVFVRLNTPAEVCIERTWKRQELRGKGKSAEQEDRTYEQELALKEKQVKAVESSVKSLRQRGFPTAVLQWDAEPMAQLDDLFKWGGYDCEHERVPLVDWDAHFDEYANGWRPPVFAPSYQLAEPALV